MKKPLVSILIASYNKEKYVKRCIKSCLNQTYKNIEIIFVDDSSRDNSYKFASEFKKIKTYKKKRKKFNSKFNTFYQIDNFIYGLRKSKGKIISFLDVDDFYKNNKIKNIVQHFEKYGKSKILFDKPMIYFSKKKVLKKNFYKDKGRGSLWPKFPPTSCISLRRNFFLKILNELKNKKFSLLAIDFRIAVISKVIFNDFKILNKYLTFYFQDKQGSENINYKKFSKTWWNRRMQAHEYMIYLFKKNKIKYQNLDYSMTKIINLFL